jgi:hypothetical protein
MNMGIIAGSRLRGTGINPLFENSEAYYKCDGTTINVLLDSKNSFDGELNQGITQGVTGFINNAVESDGSNQSYLSIPRDTFDENDFSVSFWLFYSSEFPSTRLILRGNDNGGFNVQFSENISVVFFGVGSIPSNTSDLILDSWNQIIIQKLNNNIKVYVNNDLKINGSTTLYNNTNLTDNLTFGIVLNSAGVTVRNASSTFKIDEIDIRKEQYTQEQRNELYNNGNGTTI